MRSHESCYSDRHVEHDETQQLKHSFVSFFWLRAAGSQPRLFRVPSALPTSADFFPSLSRMYAVYTTALVTYKRPTFPAKQQRNFIVYPYSRYWLDGLKGLEFRLMNASYFFLFQRWFTTIDNHLSHSVGSVRDETFSQDFKETFPYLVLLFDYKAKFA
jgi:hypothetical protein